MKQIFQKMLNRIGGKPTLPFVLLGYFKTAEHNLPLSSPPQPLPRTPHTPKLLQCHPCHQTDPSCNIQPFVPRTQTHKPHHSKGEQGGNDNRHHHHILGVFRFLLVQAQLLIPDYLAG